MFNWIDNVPLNLWQRWTSYNERQREGLIFVCMSQKSYLLFKATYGMYYILMQRKKLVRLPEKFTTNVQIEVLMKVLSLKNSLQWWLQFLMTLCYKDSMNCQFIILEVIVLTAINNSVFPQMISCQGTSGDQSIGLSNVMQRHFFSHFRSYYVWCHGASLNGELVFDCSRKHLERLIDFISTIFLEQYCQILLIQMVVISVFSFLTSGNIHGEQP